MIWTKKTLAMILIFSLLTMWSWPVIAQEAKPAEKLNCPYCGAENFATSKFCGACGSKLPSPRLSSPTLDETKAIPPEAMATESPVATFVPSDSLQVKALYDSGLQLIYQGAYSTAALHFKRIVQEYPASQYAEASAQLAKACEKLALAETTMEQKAVKKGNQGGAAFGGAFLGSTLGMVGGFLLLLMMSSGGMD